MKVGDLVRFNGGPVFTAATSGYAATGVIIEVGNCEFRDPHKRSYKVLWADGKETKEWFSYLEVLNESR